MEAIITVVGFLGAGKTTLLKQLTNRFLSNDWQPYIILNDYENAYIDAQDFIIKNNPKWVKALSGSCICCSGIDQLRQYINGIPERKKGVVLIEANGTSDACTLMEFLGVGLKDRFLPPIQISVVDVKNWQKRGEHNTLEANQIQTSSLIVLTHLENISKHRKTAVISSLKNINPLAEITTLELLDETLIPQLKPIKNQIKKLDHLQSHWSSCSIDLPKLSHLNAIKTICNNIPQHILRVKGCTHIAADNHYTYFERTPDGTVSIRKFNGVPITGSKLLCIGPRSSIVILEKAIEAGLQTKN
ncbi:GTP-binding protein [Pseudotamlana agarivorans]|uniref:GTP-binding protein n=1 Tax=Pseudotamlana agarivorans TaxID=481183 RepID=UPI000829DD1B|nr:GTP-binding protein [Tamlana agarivorans]